MPIDWDDPAARGRLIERVGAEEYSRLLAIHFKQSTLATINGHAIRPVMSRFGRLFSVGNTNRAFATLGEAAAFARATP